MDCDGDEIVEHFSRHGTLDVVQCWIDDFSRHNIEFCVPPTVSDDDVFRGAYCSLLKCPDPQYAAFLLEQESKYASDLSKLIRARDWEIERLKKEHTSIVNIVVHDTKSQKSEEEINRSAARYFENLHLIEANYASQISFIVKEQKREFRNLVLDLRQKLALEPRNPVEKKASVSVPPKSFSLLSINEPKSNLTESFTIHLGAQLKTMHNLRLIRADSIEFCRFSAHDCDASQQLNTALGLYSVNMLHGLLVLVDNRHMYHINLQTAFSRACEERPELHFDLLEDQLQAMEKDVSRANTYKQQAIAVKDGSDTLPYGKELASVEILSFGDVYITRHSNLAKIHVVFHMACSDDLKTQDINSRHPCINGVRNVVRSCYKFGISTISLPLLLVERMNENMTVSWCLKRAELVYKCVKGFMMECATTNDKLQLTVQFLVPPDLSDELFHQLSDLLQQVFHVTSPFRI